MESFGPKDVPRFVHPDDKKLKKAIEHDMKILMKQSKSERLFGSEDEVEIVRQHLDDCELVE